MSKVRGKLPDWFKLAGNGMIILSLVKGKCVVKNYYIFFPLGVYIVPAPQKMEQQGKYFVFDIHRHFGLGKK